MKKSKKIIGGIAGTLCACVLATGGLLVGCGNNQPKEALTSTTEVYAFAGATTGMLMGMNPSSAVKQAETPAFSQMSAISTVNQTGDTSLKDKIKETISSSLDKYMNVFDSIVGGEKPIDVKETSVEIESEYNNRLEIKVTSIDGSTDTFIMYYSETLLEDPDQEVEDSDEEERETKLVGELYINSESESLPLYIEGKKEIDLEDGESEITFEARLNKDDDENKVVFKQEREKENGKIEEEYQFTLVVGGFETNMSFSMERDAQGNIEVEYEHMIGDYSINFEIEKKDNTLTIETKDFFNTELKISVTVEKTPEGEKYVYYIPSLDLEIKGSVISK